MDVLDDVLDDVRMRIAWWSVWLANGQIMREGERARRTGLVVIHINQKSVYP
jgi:hypothetical protein